ncbi:unnamed protein product [Adineta ricciae]|uniref:Receptor expression-enhancing protein n=1 Tax=Adineta ricciae TaxID=249248 RepID=A0A816CQJ8_ADIRI|nr:unnamed protein product [Adineta ricciae]
MAAAIKPYLHKVELKVKPYLQEGPLSPYWQLLENKTKAKREHIALGLLALLAIYLAFGWANDFLCNLIGFIYPAYASVLAVESKGTHDDTEWLIYWVVYAVCGIIEYVGHNFFHSLPFYWLGKCLFLIWLMVPGQKGGSYILYQRLIRPVFQKIHSTVEKPARESNIYPRVQTVGSSD